MSKNYRRRSNISFMICTPLIIISTISFYTSPTNMWPLVTIVHQWTTATFIIGLCYHIIADSEYRPATTRREEFIFLTIRMIVLMPLLILVLGIINSKWDGILSASSAVCLCTLFLFLDKFELEILRYATAKTRN